MRLLQVVALAAFCLVAIRLTYLASTGVFEGIAIAPAQAQEEQQDAEVQPAENADQETEPADTADANPEPRNVDVGNVRNIEELDNRSSRAKIAERLGERREALEKRERDLELREQLLEAAESRLKRQIERLKELEAKEAKAQEDGANQTAKDLVTIYENMKPKDAAKIFNALSLDILHTIATSMNPRKMSAVLAEMEVKKAERLTVEIALRAAREQQIRRNGSDRTLEKING
ncbi:MAG: hypothetical protein AAGE61_12720 [Pseudomonadota bacterium]